MCNFIWYQTCSISLEKAIKIHFLIPLELNPEMAASCSLNQILQLGVFNKVGIIIVLFDYKFVSLHKSRIRFVDFWTKKKTSDTWFI